MNNQEKVAEKVHGVLKGLFRDGRLNDLQLEELAGELTKKAFGTKPATRSELLSLKKPKGRSPKVLYYNPRAALKVIAHAIEAITAHEMVNDPSHYVLTGAAAILCGTALRDVRHKPTEAEAVLLYSIYSCADGEASRETAAKMFNEACQLYPEIKREDFTAALQNLLTADFIEEKKESLRIKQRMHLSNIVPIFESR